MRNFSVPLLLALALGACASSGPKTYEGVYVTGMAVETFYLEGRLDPYWVTAERSAREELGALIPTTLPPGAAARVAVVVEGERSERGQYGPLGAYDRELLIRRVVSARLIDPAPEGAAAAVESPAEPAPARRGWRWPWSNPETVPPPPPERPPETPEASETPPNTPAPRPWLRWPWGRRPN